MVMTLKAVGSGDLLITQKLERPAVYLDHWAVRKFSTDKPLQDRFVGALHGAKATWLFSSINLFEFVAMTDLDQAKATEELLLRVLPRLHVADTALDKGYWHLNGAPASEDAPADDWILESLAARAAIKGGEWNTHRFIQDAILHREQLLPLFTDMKSATAKELAAAAADPENAALAKKFAPTKGMPLRKALQRELLRENHIHPNVPFTDNDVTDLAHALPAVIVCDFVLLDGAWCHKIEKAERRLRQGGVTGRLGRCYSPKTVSAFLSQLEAHTANSPDT